MKNIHQYIILAVVIIIIVLVLNLRKPADDFDTMTFEQAYNLLADIDAKYNTSFKTERINRTMIDKDLVDDYEAELLELRAKINASESKEKQRIRLFS